MNTPPEDRLGQMLSDWADRHAPSAKDLAWLEARITAAVSDEKFLDAPPVPLAAARSVARGRLLWFSLGAAATVLVALALRLGRHDAPAGPDPRETVQDRAAVAAFSDEQLAEKRVLLAEMSRLFADRLTWVAEDGGEVCVGTARSGERTSDGLPIAVRVVVLTRKVGDREWKPARKLDVVTRGEQWVDVAPLAPLGLPQQKLQLWTMLLPDGMVAVDASLAVDGGARPATFSGVQAAGSPNRAFRLTKGGTEYQVFQTVSLLKHKVG